MSLLVALLFIFKQKTKAEFRSFRLKIRFVRIWGFLSVIESQVQKLEFIFEFIFQSNHKGFFASEESNFLNYKPRERMERVEI